MNFQLVGLNHTTAPVEVRERFAIPESRLPEATQRLAQHPGIEEAMIVSTCNRVELLARTTNGAADLRSFIRGYFPEAAQEIDKHLYEFHGREAVQHVFRVASSLDSMVVGEPQILGQVKEAYAVARAAGTVSSQLDALVTRAFAVAKRVRSETLIGTSAVSVASVAVELAEKIFGSLHGKKVYLVGAGKMSELAARHLMAHGAASIFVANRTYEKAVALAAHFHGEAIHFDKLYETADQADIVITSTGCPYPIFKTEHAQLFLHRRKNRPMFFIDIAVPRDVDPAVNKLEGIFLYDIDDLQQVVKSHVSDRRREAERADQIIAIEVERFEARLKSLDVVPTIVSLQEHFDNIRQAEIERYRGRLGELSSEQEQVVEALTRGIINKILHTPISALKSAAREPEGASVVGLVRQLFNLSSKESEEEAEKKGAPR